MTFSKFCEAIFDHPLFRWEKKCAEFLEEHPDAKLLHPIARGSSRMSYDVPDGWEEISLEEFKSRRAMHFKRLHSEIHDKKEKEKNHENN